jgi:hypothetical protein
LTGAEAEPIPRIQTGLSHRDLAFSALATMMQELPSALAQQSPTRKGEATDPLIIFSGR